MALFSFHRQIRRTKAASGGGGGHHGGGGGGGHGHAHFTGGWGGHVAFGGGGGGRRRASSRRALSRRAARRSRAVGHATNTVAQNIIAHHIGFTHGVPHLRKSSSPKELDKAIQAGARRISRASGAPSVQDAEARLRRVQRRTLTRKTARRQQSTLFHAIRRANARPAYRAPFGGRTYRQAPQLPLSRNDRRRIARVNRQGRVVGPQRLQRIFNRNLTRAGAESRSYVRKVRRGSFTKAERPSKQAAALYKKFTPPQGSYNRAGIRGVKQTPGQSVVQALTGVSPRSSKPGTAAQAAIGAASIAVPEVLAGKLARFAPEVARATKGAKPSLTLRAARAATKPQRAARLAATTRAAPARVSAKVAAGMRFLRSPASAYRAARISSEWRAGRLGAKAPTTARLAGRHAAAIGARGVLGKAAAAGHLTPVTALTSAARTRIATNLAASLGANPKKATERTIEAVPGYAGFYFGGAAAVGGLPVRLAKGQSIGKALDPTAGFGASLARQTEQMIKDYSGTPTQAIHATEQRWGYLPHLTLGLASRPVTGKAYRHLREHARTQTFQAFEKAGRVHRPRLAGEGAPSVTSQVLFNVGKRTLGGSGVGEFLQGKPIRSTASRIYGRATVYEMRAEHDAMRPLVKALRKVPREQGGFKGLTRRQIATAAKEGRTPNDVGGLVGLLAEERIPSDARKAELKLVEIINRNPTGSEARQARFILQNPHVLSRAKSPELWKAVEAWQGTQQTLKDIGVPVSERAQHLAQAQEFGEPPPEEIPHPAITHLTDATTVSGIKEEVRSDRTSARAVGDVRKGIEGELKTMRNELNGMRGAEHRQIRGEISGLMADNKRALQSVNRRLSKVQRQLEQRMANRDRLKADTAVERRLAAQQAHLTAQAHMLDSERQLLQGHPREGGTSPRAAALRVNIQQSQALVDNLRAHENAWKRQAKAKDAALRGTATDAERAAAVEEAQTFLQRPLSPHEERQAVAAYKLNQAHDPLVSAEQMKIFNANMERLHAREGVGQGTYFPHTDARLEWHDKSAVGPLRGGEKKTWMRQADEASTQARGLTRYDTGTMFALGIQAPIRSHAAGQFTREIVDYGALEHALPGQAAQKVFREDGVTQVYATGQVAKDEVPVNLSRMGQFTNKASEDYFNLMAEMAGRKGTTPEWEAIRDSGEKGDLYAFMPRELSKEVIADLAHGHAVLRGFSILGRGTSRIILGSSLAWLIAQPFAEGMTLAMAQPRLLNPMTFYRSAKAVAQIHKDPESRRLMEKWTGGVAGITSGLSRVGEEPLRVGQAYDQVFRPMNRSFFGELVHKTTTLEFPQMFDRWKGSWIRQVGFASELDKQLNGFLKGIHGSYLELEKTANDLKGKSLADQMSWAVRNPKAAERIGNYLDDTLGNWSALTRFERAAAPFLIFYPFMRFSLNFVFKTFPRRHPVTAAITTFLAGLNANQLRQLFPNGQPGFLTDWAMVPYWGNGPDKPPTTFIPLSRALPGANVLTEVLGGGDLTSLTRALNPVLGIPLNAAMGRNSFGDLYLPPGAHFTTSGKIVDKNGKVVSGVDYQTFATLVGQNILNLASPVRGISQLRGVASGQFPWSGQKLSPLAVATGGGAKQRFIRSNVFPFLPVDVQQKQSQIQAAQDFKRIQAQPDVTDVSRLKGQAKHALYRKKKGIPLTPRQQQQFDRYRAALQGQARSRAAKRSLHRISRVHGFRDPFWKSLRGQIGTARGDQRKAAKARRNMQLGYPLSPKTHATDAAKLRRKFRQLPFAALALTQAGKPTKAALKRRQGRRFAKAESRAIASGANFLGGSIVKTFRHKPQPSLRQIARRAVRGNRKALNAAAAYQQFAQTKDRKRMLPLLRQEARRYKRQLAGQGKAAQQRFGKRGKAGKAPHPYLNPYNVKGLTYAGEDQGIDFTGKGPIGAIGNAKIVDVATHTGWAGEGSWIKYKLLDGPKKGRFVYVAEDFKPHVHKGQTVHKGQVIAHATGSGAAPGIETGWAARTGNHQPLAPEGSTALGHAFHQFVTRAPKVRPTAQVAAVKRPPASQIHKWLKKVGSDTNVRRLGPTFQHALIRLARASGQPIRINEGFRSLARQKYLYAHQGQGGIGTAAKPGTSNHEKGLAIDANLTSKQRGLLSKFGLHTPVSGEPWHVELTHQPSTQAPAGGKPLVFNGTPQQKHRAQQALRRFPGLDHEQAKVATTILNQGLRQGANRKELVTAMAVGLTESTLRNLGGGSGSSVGWRQETSPYGSVAKRTNVKGAAQRFFQEAKKHGSGKGQTIYGFAQAIQASGAGAASGGQSNYGPNVSKAIQIVNHYLKNKAVLGRYKGNLVPPSIGAAGGGGTTSSGGVSGTSAPSGGTTPTAGGTTSQAGAGGVTPQMQQMLANQQLLDQATLLRNVSGVTIPGLTRSISGSTTAEGTDLDLAQQIINASLAPAKIRKRTLTR